MKETWHVYKYPQYKTICGVSLPEKIKSNMEEKVTAYYMKIDTVLRIVFGLSVEE